MNISDYERSSLILSSNFEGGVVGANLSTTRSNQNFNIHIYIINNSERKLESNLHSIVGTLQAVIVNTVTPNVFQSHVEK